MASFENEVLRILQNKGLLTGKKLILDATVFPSRITYPNDVKLLNTVREWGCVTILKIKQRLDPTQKIRTYRKTAQKVYLKFQKTKKKTTIFIRKTRNQLLRFTKRNLDQLEVLIPQAEAHILSTTSELKMAALATIKARFAIGKEIYAQQLQMAQTKGRRIANRIVSFHQPEVRPIVRGKEGKAVEFGPKAHVAIVDGYAILEDCQFDNFHEGIQLPACLEKHQARFGKKPDLVLGDQLYATKANRKILQEHDIQHGFKRIGRPPNVTQNIQKKGQSYLQKTSGATQCY